MKEKIIDNLIENIIDECEKNTIVEYASAFDLNFQTDMETRSEYIKQLYSIYGITYNHEVVNKSTGINFEIMVQRNVSRNFMIQYCQICSASQYLFTNLFEGAFSKLAKICCKDRNAMFSGTIETLFSLSVMNIYGTNPDICRKQKTFQ